MKTSPTIFGKIQRFLNKGQSQRAIRELQDALREDPQDMRILHKLGDLYMKEGYPAEGIDAYLQVAESYVAESFHQKALAVYKQILKIDENNKEAQIRLIEVFVALDRRSDALAQYQQLAFLLEQEGRLLDAIAAYQEMLTLEPDNIPFLVKLAELFLAASDPASARASFEDALLRLETQQRWADYLKVSERLLFLEPDSLPLLKKTASVYLKLGESMKAAGKLQQAFKIDRQDIETLELLVQTFSSLSQTSKTVSVLRELAKTYQSRKTYDKARSTFLKILTLQPDDAPTREALVALNREEEEASAATPKPPQPPKPSAPPPSLFSRTAPPPTSPPHPKTAPPPATSVPPSPSSEPLTPPTLEKLLAEAEVFIKYGLHHRVQEKLDAILAREPRHLLARRLRAELFQTLEKPNDSAREWMELASLCDDPKDAIRYTEQILEMEGVAPQLQEEAYQLSIRLRKQNSLPTQEDSLLSKENVGEEAEILFLEDEDEGSDLSPSKELGTNPAFVPPLVESDLLPVHSDLDEEDSTQLQSSRSVYQDFAAPPTENASPNVPPAPTKSLGENTSPSLGALSAIPPSLLAPTPPPGNLFAVPPLPAVPPLSAVPPIPPALVSTPPVTPPRPVNPPSVAFPPAKLAPSPQPPPPQPPPPKKPPPKPKDDAGDIEAAAARLAALIQAKEAEESGVPIQSSAPADELPPPPFFSSPASASAAPSQTFAPPPLAANPPLKPLPPAPPSPLNSPPPPLSAPPPAPPLSPASNGNPFASPPAPSFFAKSSPPALPRLASSVTNLPPNPPPSPWSPPPAPSSFSRAESPQTLPSSPSSFPPRPPLAEPPPSSPSRPPLFSEPPPLATSSPSQDLKTGESNGLPKDPPPSFEDFEELDEGLILEEVSPFAEQLEEAELYMEQGEYEYALALYKKILEKEPRHDDAFQGKEKALSLLESSKLQKEQQASLDLDSALGQTGNVPKRSRSRVVEEIKQFQQAAQAAAGEEGDTHFELGIAYQGMGLFSQAIDAFQNCIRLGYREANSYKMIGSIYAEQGKYQQAIRSYQKALQLPKIDPSERLDLLYEMGNAHERNGSPPEALKCFEEVSGLEPTYRGVLQRLSSLRSSM